MLLNLTTDIKSASKPLPVTNSGWDEALCIQGCIENDRRAQEMLYKKFYPVMMSVVQRYTSDSDAAVSILNNGFLKVYKNLKSFRGEGSFEGWIRRIMVHCVSDYFRAEKKVKIVAVEDAPASLGSLTVTSDLKYDYNKLLQVFSILPAATRVVLNLFLIDGFTHKEISKMLGISENTSKWHVCEGRKLLHEKLSRQ